VTKNTTASKPVPTKNTTGKVTSITTPTSVS
jgi:hypothetical protein